MKKAPPTLEDLYSCRPMAIWAQVKTEHIAFWVVCGYLFFEYIRPQTIYPVIDFLPWAAMLGLGSLLLSFIDNQPKPRGNPVNKLMVIYGIVILMSVAAAVQPRLGWDNLNVYFNWLLVYFAIVRIVHTRARFFIFFLLYMLCNFKMSQHGFLSWASRGFAFSDWGVTGSPGWFHNSGEFGIQLSIYIPLSLAFVYALRPYWNRVAKVFFYLMPFTAVCSVMATSSRGAMLGLVAAGAWAIRLSKYFIRASIGIVLIGALVWVATPAEFKARFETAGTDRTSLHRLHLWEKAWETMKERPLFGVGHQNWEVYYRARLAHTGEGHGGTAMVHNMFIQAGSELGFIGLGTLLLLCLYMMILNRRVRIVAKARDMRFEYYISHGMDGALIALAVSGSFITVLYYPYIWMHAAMVAALYSSTMRVVDQEKQLARNTRSRAALEVSVPVR